MARISGTKNKNREFLLNRLRDMYGDDFNPILKMAANCARLQGIVDGEDDSSEDIVGYIKAANGAWDGIAEYVQPKLKSIDITGGLDVKKTVQIVNLSGDIDG